MAIMDSDVAHCFDLNDETETGSTRHVWVKDVTYTLDVPMTYGEGVGGMPWASR